MSARAALIGCAAACAIAAGCSEAPAPAAPEPDPQQVVEEPPLDVEQAPQALPAPIEPILWEVPIFAADVGGHLVDSQFAAGLPALLSELRDQTLAALPARALYDAGAVLSPSETSSTNETLWIHVITDESAEAASEWVRYLSERPAAVALQFTSPQHDLFDARKLETPVIGDASVVFELLRGHSGARWRTTVAVFAQDSAVVFLVLPRRSSAGALSEPEPPGAVLTDLDAVAALAEERLRAMREAALSDPETGAEGE